MKNILIMSAFALCLSMLTGNTTKASDCNLQDCAASINGDAGVTSSNCTSPGGQDLCSCTAAATGCDYVKYISAGSNCATPWLPYGLMMDGRKCCGKGSGCAVKLEIDLQAQESFESTQSNNAGLGEVFEADMEESRADTFFGYIDGVVRSPTVGRTTAAKAKLDACLYYSDVDWIETNGGSDNSEKHATCVGSTYGCGNTTNKNEYCKATGMNDGVSVTAAVCKDRCDCVYSQGTCAGL